MLFADVIVLLAVATAGLVAGRALGVPAIVAYLVAGILVGPGGLGFVSHSEGIGQLRKVAAFAEMHHKLVAPHHGGGGLGLAAHLHLACAIPNSSYFEMLHEPPGMSADDFQWYLAEPLRVDRDGDIVAPDRPGTA